ncbi:hypothetical protein TNCV_2695481 [Trichonephila clavipes]|nr:hypothetical protein TNCV_2695481 [Trichonephila clavipes]
MPSPVQSNCDAHDTIANGQYGAVWSMGHTQQICDSKDAKQIARVQTREEGLNQSMLILSSTTKTSLQRQ